jgi:lipopolysaccharide/colanic/teichoic acid biosynthesis glycosyltransferase
MDLTIGTALLVLLAPFWLLISLVIRFMSAGPAIFTHERVGLNGKCFRMFKFRTMYVDAEPYAFSPQESVDPRITSFGQFLRRTSLDELPQLLNVIKGDMSLVGPRPEMGFIVEQYTSEQRQRLSVKPGITGLWQLSADRRFLIHENIEYDLYYIRNRNVFVDFAILLHTLIFAMHGV